MRIDAVSVAARSRRHFIRIAAKLGVVAAVGLGSTQTSRAAGWHSDPNFCDPVCLLRGTRLETAVGDVAVEKLQAGDLVRTLEGLQPVRWIGQRSYVTDAYAKWPSSVDPVLIEASAIADGVPRRDLFLSPKHALFIDGYLIPVMFLINGENIRQKAYHGQAVDYFHVECEAHQIMFAEGLPVETFRLQDDYEAFANFADHAHRLGDPVAPVEPFAPVLGYWSLREEALALLRSIGATWFDLLDPIHVAYDRIAARAAAHSAGRP